MEHAVAHAADDGREDQRLVTLREAHQHRARNAKRNAEEQHAPRAEPVRGKPRKRLADAGDRVIEAGNRAQRRVAHAEVVFQQREQRRDEELQEMRHRMRDGNEADRSDVG